MNNYLVCRDKSISKFYIKKTIARGFLGLQLYLRSWPMLLFSLRSLLGFSTYVQIFFVKAKYLWMTAWSCQDKLNPFLLLCSLTSRKKIRQTTEQAVIKAKIFVSIYAILISLIRLRSILHLGEKSHTMWGQFGLAAVGRLCSNPERSHAGSNSLICNRCYTGNHVMNYHWITFHGKLHPMTACLWDSQIHRPLLGVTVDSDIGLSYRPASLYVAWRDNPLPESTLSP